MSKTKLTDQIDDEYKEDEDSPDSFSYEIMNYPADTTLKGYVDLWEKNHLNPPKFQRDFIWERKRASKLIESFLLGLPVPGIFLYKEKNEPGYLIIDGHQRLMSIISFQKEKFISGKNCQKIFCLTNVDPRWDGKTFSQLTEHEQFTIENSVLRSIIIQQLDPNDNSSIYPIFERLNTGGLNLNPMQVRMCVAESKFTDLLKELNKNSIWRQITEQKNEDITLKHLELILRFFALREFRNDYEKPMKKFLNKFIENQKSISEEKIQEYKAIFNNTLKLASQLGDGLFSISRTKLNFSVFDSIMIALSCLESENQAVEVLKKKIEALKKNDEYIKWVTQSTGDKNSVISRIEKAIQIFSGN